MSEPVRRRSGSASARRAVVPAVRLEDVTKSYGELVAFECDELEILEGESVVLVGHNGSGKSTMLNLVAGSLEPSAGTVRVFGDEPGSPRARALRSWLPDSPVLYDDLSVMEHLQYVSRLHGGSGDEAALVSLVRRLGLEGRSEDLPAGFSRGLRQKTAVAVALCRPFSLLMVDEPFVGLDTAGRAALLDLLDEARESGATVIVATHDPVVIDRFERGIALRDGHVVHDGTTDGLRDVLGIDDLHHGD